MTISPVQGDWVPLACTQPTVKQPIRVAEFDQFFTTSARPAPAGLDVIVDPAVETVFDQGATVELAMALTGHERMETALAYDRRRAQRSADEPTGL